MLAVSLFHLIWCLCLPPPVESNLVERCKWALVTGMSTAVCFELGRRTVPACVSVTQVPPVFYPLCARVSRRYCQSHGPMVTCVITLHHDSIHAHVPLADSTNQIYHLAHFKTSQSKPSVFIGRWCAASSYQCGFQQCVGECCCTVVTHLLCSLCFMAVAPSQHILIPKKEPLHQVMEPPLTHLHTQK